MLTWIKSLDRILRGEATRRTALETGQIEVSVRGLTVVLILLGMLYGLCMGSYAVVTGKGGGWLQMLSSMAKVPALFLLTLAVTFPSLYVFNALVGSRLTLHSVLRLIVAAMSVMLALLASFGTIVAFFSFTTESYSFIVLLNVLVFAVSGALGLGFLLQTLHRLTLIQEGQDYEAWLKERSAQQEETTNTQEDTAPGTTDQSAADAPAPSPRVRQYILGALERIPDRPPAQNTRNVFRIWVIVFGLVGAQMSWVLRPFLGSGDTFALFREKESNFFLSVWQQLSNLLGK